MVAEAQAQRRHRKRMFKQPADPCMVYALGGGGGEQRDADGLVLKDGQDELAPRLVREFLAAEASSSSSISCGGRLLEAMKTDVSTEAVSSGESTRSALTFTCNLSRKLSARPSTSAMTPEGISANCWLRGLQIRASRSPEASFSSSRQNGPFLACSWRRRADEVQRSDFRRREPRLWPTGGRARIVFSAYSTYNKKLCDRLSVRKASPYSRNVWREFTRFRLCCQQKACGPSGLRLSVCFLWENCFCCFGRLRAYLAFQR